MAHEILAHTADVKIAVRGADLLDLHQGAVDAVRELLVGESEGAEVEVVVLPREDVDLPEQFFRFVRELLYLYDVDRFVPGRVVSLAPPRVAGEPFDAARHEHVHGVKALTRHQYAFEEGPEGFRAEMVFDL